MKNISLKKLASLFLAIALAFTCVAIPTNTVQAAKTKAIKVTNIKGSTKSIKEGKCFKLKTNYAASKLNFKSSNEFVTVVLPTGVVVAKNKGTAKVTISLKKNAKVKKTITVKVTKGKAGKYLSKKDFNVSGFEGGGIEYNNKVYSNFIDYLNAGGKDCHYIMYDPKDTEVDYKTFKTNRGIKMGDTVSKLMKAYDGFKWTLHQTDDKNMNTKKHTAKYTLTYELKGYKLLMFYLDQNDKVMCISYGY